MGDYGEPVFTMQFGADGVVVIQANNDPFCLTYDNEEIARRIVACVNFCAGVPTEELENDEWLVLVKTDLDATIG